MIMTTPWKKLRNFLNYALVCACNMRLNFVGHWKWRWLLMVCRKSTINPAKIFLPTLHPCVYKTHLPLYLLTPARKFFLIHWRCPFPGPELGKISTANEEMNVNFHRAFQLDHRNAPIASAPLGMFCLDSVSSLLARLLPWNGHRSAMTVTQTLHMLLSTNRLGSPTSRRSLVFPILRYLCVVGSLAAAWQVLMLERTYVARTF